MKIKQSIFRGAAGSAGALLMVAATNNLPAQLNYTTLSVPGSQDTYAEGISGDIVAGYYVSSGGADEGFIYNGGTYTTLNVPDATHTFVYGISGNYVVGWGGNAYEGEEFVYNISSGTYSALNNVLQAYGVSGNTIVGSGLYGPNGSSRGVLYNLNGNYSLLSVPGAQNTSAYGIDGNNVVGQSTIGSFLYSGGYYTMLPMLNGQYTEANGISGNNIVGYYYTGGMFSEVANGFVYNINNSGYESFDIPGATGTYAQGIDGNDVVGYYQKGGVDYGFLATSVPEPSDFGLLAAGVTALVAGRVRKLPLS